MSQKRILFLASWYPSKNNPNLGNFVQRHAEAANEYVNVTALFVTSSEHYQTFTIEREVIYGVETFCAYYPKITGGVPFYTALRKYKSYLKFCKKAYESIAKDFDLVHLNIAYPAGLFALWLKRNKKIPFVLTEQWTGYLPLKGDYKKLTRLQKSLHKAIFKQAENIFPVSDHLGRALISVGLIRDYEVLYNVVDHQVFYPSSEENKSFRFVHVSTFDDAHKNVSGMFRTFKRLQEEGADFEVKIVTEGDQQTVINLAEKYRLSKGSVSVACSLDQHGVAAELRKANCLVLFSNYETFSVVLAEAWMSGIPCVYSKCGGLTEINNSNIGLQVGAKDEEQLYTALQKVLSNEISFDKEKITAFARDFRKSTIALHLQELYKKALA